MKNKNQNRGEEHKMQVENLYVLQKELEKAKAEAEEYKKSYENATIELNRVRGELENLVEKLDKHVVLINLLRTLLK